MEVQVLLGMKSRWTMEIQMTFEQSKEANLQELLLQKHLSLQV